MGGVGATFGGDATDAAIGGSIDAVCAAGGGPVCAACAAGGAVCAGTVGAVLVFLVVLLVL